MQTMKLQGQRSAFEIIAFQTFGFAYLHNNYSYDDLTEQYLNRGYMGHQYAQPIYGYPAAAKFYFRKDVSSLSDQEIASLILISRAPALYTKPQNAQRLAEESTQLLEAAKN